MLFLLGEANYDTNLSPEGRQKKAPSPTETAFSTGAMRGGRRRGRPNKSPEPEAEASGSGENEPPHKKIKARKPLHYPPGAEEQSTKTRKYYIYQILL